MVDSPTNRDSVHECDDWLGVVKDQVIKSIFIEEKLACVTYSTIQQRTTHRDNIPASAEAAAFGMIDHHSSHRRVTAPGKQRVNHTHNGTIAPSIQSFSRPLKNAP